MPDEQDRFCDTSLRFIKLLTKEELDAIEKAAQERLRAAAKAQTGA